MAARSRPSFGAWLWALWLSAPLVAQAQGSTCQEINLPRADHTGPGTVVTWDCARFEGEFAKGKLRKGRISYRDGEVLEGTFGDHDRLEGQGSRRFRDGTIQEGNFVRGGLVGEARITMPDGRRFQGDTLHGRPNGHGTLTHPDGSVDRGFFTPDGQPIGFIVRTMPDGSRLAGEFRAGKPFGDVVTARPDGSGEIRSHAWGGGPAAPASAPGSAGSPQTGAGSATTADAPLPSPSPQPATAPTQTIDEVQRAVRGLRGLFGR